MVRHISIFFLKKNENVTAKEKAYVEKLLLQLKQELDDVADYRVGTQCLPVPPTGTAGVPLFGDIVQSIDFTDIRAAESYPQQPGHRRLVEKTQDFVEKVVSIDFFL